MKQQQHFEKGDLTGEISVSFKDGLTLEGFFSKYLNDFNTDRFEPFAIRVFLGKEIFFTLYAVDQYHQQFSSDISGKLMAKKFKIENISIQEAISWFKEINVTISTKNYPMESLLVLNK